MSVREKLAGTAKFLGPAIGFSVGGVTAVTSAAVGLEPVRTFVEAAAQTAGLGASATTLSQIGLPLGFVVAALFAYPTAWGMDRLFASWGR